VEVRVLSDLHREFYDDPEWDVPWDEADLDRVLVIAGDVQEGCAWARPASALEWTADRRPWIARQGDHFRAIVLVLGNHDHWGRDIQTLRGELDADLSSMGLTNVHVLYPDRPVLVDDVAFVGGTMWTDLDGENPLTVDRYHRGSGGDCRHGLDSSDPQGRLRPDRVLAEHRRTVDLMELQAREQAVAGRRVVVVTHHAPNSLSVQPRWRGNPLNGLFHSSIDIGARFPDVRLWIHGHMHDPISHMDGECHVVCNPRGLPWENNGTDQHLTLEV
jgi:Icc-related predicted phosphoesterase